jgi:conjugal transfer/type IV secretion protein DotA/TraY
MLFFGKKNPARVKASTGNGSPITIGRLFNPEIGATLRPLGETGKVLTGLIATIFAAYGLIPRNHPAVIGTGAGSSLGHVMGTAWHNLVFTREKLPQVLIFFTVVLSLGCSALAILVALLAVFSGTAHAQGTVTGASMFQPVDPGGDMACGWINWLFNTSTNGCVLQDYLSQATNGQQTLGNLQSSSVQTALITALGFYSEAILVVAAVVLFYHLVSMVVETAHHGVPMGRRASQVWAPIRLVVAIGLLVPVSSGLNSGQFIVIQLAQWGSGLASQTWSTFVQALVADSGNLGPANAPYVRQVVTDTVMMEACVYAFNQISKSEATSNGITTSVSSIPQTPSCVTLDSENNQKCSFQPQSSGGGTGPTSDADLKDVDLCGLYILRGTPPAAANASPAETQAAQAQSQANSAYTSMLSAAYSYAQQGMQNFVPQQDGGTQGGTLSQNTSFESLVSNYQQALQSAATSATGSFSSDMQNVASSTSSQGWVSAGAWFNTIARVVGDIATIIRDLLPHTTPPKVGLETMQNKLGKNTPEYQTMEAMRSFQQWFNDETNSNAGGGAGSNTLMTAAAGMAQSGGTQTHVMDYIFWLIDWIASYDGVWSPPGSFDQATQTTAQTFTLGVQFTSANPLAEIANLGHANINAAYDLFDAYLLLQSIAGGLQEGGSIAQALNRLPVGGMILNLLGVVGQIGSAAVAAVGSVLGTITVVFFTAGFMLAYFFPLIPFFRFTFGAIGWFLSLLESIVAVPLIALAHLTPEGEGLPGEKAKAAYYMLFNLMLKPVMMIFGLIIGLLIFNLAASAINLLYMTAVVGSGGISHGHITLARLAYSIVYVAMLYLCCNNCFKMIDYLPEHCIKWMGGTPLHHPQMTDPSEIGGYMTAAAGYVDSKIVGASGDLMKNVGPVGLGALMKAQPSLQGGMKSAIGNMSNKFAPSQTGNAQKYLGGYVDAATSVAGEAGNAVQNPKAAAEKLAHKLEHLVSGGGGDGSGGSDAPSTPPAGGETPSTPPAGGGTSSTPPATGGTPSAPPATGGTPSSTQPSTQTPAPQEGNNTGNGPKSNIPGANRGAS